MRAFFVGLSALLLTGALPAAAQDWTQQWFDAQAAGGPTYFEGQKRSYLQGGSFNGRFRMANDQIFSVTPPRFNVGCGGIDMFAGGITFLDPEYLIDKLENILQAAPAMAFSIALKTLCEPCEDIMSRLEEATNFLNNMALNDCAEAKALVAPVEGWAESFKKSLEVSQTEAALDGGLAKNAQNVQEEIRANGNEAQYDAREQVENCPVPVKEIFDGSFVQNAANRAGAGPMADTIRGLIGDVVVSWEPGQNVPNYREIAACEGNDGADISDFIFGTVQSRPDDANGCRAATGFVIRDWSADAMTGLANRIANGLALTPADESFIGNAPVPIFKMLETAVVNDVVPVVIGSYTDLVSYYFAYRVYNDLLSSMTWAITKAQADASAQGDDPAVASDEPCNTSLYAPIIQAFPQMRDRVVEMRAQVRDAYALALNEQRMSLQVVSLELQNIRGILANQLKVKAN